MNCKVSVIVPVYNVEKYLRRCVDTLLQQTLRDIEVVLVDDGSPDNCPQICDEYQEKDQRVKVVHKPNGGLSDARNAGLAIARGGYVLFVDSDDWVENDMLESMHSRAEVDSSDVVVCSYCIEYPNNAFSVNKELPANISSTDDIAEAIYALDMKGMFNSVWNKLYRRELLQRHHLTFAVDGVPGEDLLFNCDVFERIKRTSFDNRILYHYMRQDEDTLVTAYRPNLYAQVIRFNNARKQLYDFYSMDTDEYLACYANRHIAYVFTCIPNMFKKNSDLTWVQRCTFLNGIFHDQRIAGYMSIFNENSFHYRLFRCLYKIRNGVIANSVYSVLFSFRNRFRKVYNFSRKAITLRET